MLQGLQVEEGQPSTLKAHEEPAADLQAVWTPPPTQGHPHGLTIVTGPEGAMPQLSLLSPQLHLVCVFLDRLIYVHVAHTHGAGAVLGDACEVSADRETLLGSHHPQLPAVTPGTPTTSQVTPT